MKTRTAEQLRQLALRRADRTLILVDAGRNPAEVALEVVDRWASAAQENGGTLDNVDVMQEDEYLLQLRGVVEKRIRDAQALMREGVDA